MKNSILALALLAVSSTPIAQAKASITIQMDSPTTAGVLLAALGAYLINNQKPITGIPTLITGISLATENQKIITLIFSSAHDGINKGYNTLSTMYKQFAEAYLH